MNFFGGAIVLAIVLDHSFNKRTDFCLVHIAFLFGFIAIAIQTIVLCYHHPYFASDQDMKSTVQIYLFAEAVASVLETENTSDLIFLFFPVNKAIYMTKDNNGFAQI